MQSRLRSGKFFLCALLIAFASQIKAETFDINFQDQNGSTAAVGSFNYSAVNPVGDQFFDFTVNWDGFTFDLTQTADSPAVIPGNFGSCFQSLDSAGVFEALEGLGNCGTQSYWFAEDEPADGHASFHMYIYDDDSDDPAELELSDTVVSVDGGNAVSDQGGLWSITQGALIPPIPGTPEPSGLVLALGGMILLVGVKAAGRLSASSRK